MLEKTTGTCNYAYALAPEVIYKNVQAALFVIGKKGKQPNSPATHHGFNIADSYSQILYSKEIEQIIFAYFPFKLLLKMKLFFLK